MTEKNNLDYAPPQTRGRWGAVLASCCLVSGLFGFPFSFAIAWLRFEQPVVELLFRTLPYRVTDFLLSPILLYLLLAASIATTIATGVLALHSKYTPISVARRRMVFVGFICQFLWIPAFCGLLVFALKNAR